jgi:hypothetical protein
MKLLKTLKTKFKIFIVMYHLGLSYQAAKVIVQFYDDMRDGSNCS